MSSTTSLLLLKQLIIATKDHRDEIRAQLSPEGAVVYDKILNHPTTVIKTPTFVQFNNVISPDERKKELEWSFYVQSQGFIDE